MKKIELKKINILSTGQGYQFIPIGNPDHLFGEGGMLDQLKDRIFMHHNAPVEDFWATVGRQDGQAIDWKGYMLCSGTGNDTSTGITGEEVDLLKKLHAEILLNRQRALEKVLVFDNVNFGDNDASRQLRLSVMVNPGQGALVYYQHTTSDDPLSQTGDIEYIQPQENKNYTDNGRDRLDYFFDVPSDLSSVNRFIVKVITFSRNQNETSEGLLKRIEKPHQLLRFNPDNNGFDIISSVSDADRKLKTLLLIHGTVSSTANSFKGIISSGWLKQLIKEGTYEQIIALDHPTIFAGPAENVAQLINLIGAGAKFTEKIHIITTSRGGLVGKTIVNDTGIDSNLFTVERVAAQACANGVEYFRTAAHISKGLSVLKMLFKVSSREGLEIFSAIAQTGVDFFRNQPGCVAMTIDSTPLQTILSGMPANPAMRYFPVTGNYSPDNFKQRVLNLMVKVVYNDRPNDWVVGTTQQAIMPPANYAYGQTKKWDYNYYLATTFDSIHTLYLMMNVPPSVQVAQGIPQDAIKKFLKDEYGDIL
ncbi:MAG: hypothetical protein JWP12_307 [Bacteroidetes bacterium]|nr:hypothetical protein [Bacteroidota bacterium]